MRAPAPVRGRARAPGARAARAARGLALLVAGAALGGCGDGLPLPGQGADRDYKGPPDPAVMSLSAEAESALAERFERVQAR